MKRPQLQENVNVQEFNSQHNLDPSLNPQGYQYIQNTKIDPNDVQLNQQQYYQLMQSMQFMSQYPMPQIFPQQQMPQQQQQQPEQKQYKVSSTQQQLEKQEKMQVELTDNLNYFVQELENLKCKPFDAFLKAFQNKMIHIDREVYMKIYDKYRQTKKTKEEKIKFILRKCFKYMKSKIENQQQNKDLIDDIFKNKYFNNTDEGTVLSENEIDLMPFKKESQIKTMNMKFLKFLFQSSKFVEDYFEYLENFDELAQKENQKKIEKCVQNVMDLIEKNKIDKLKTYRRLPWTQIWLNETKDLAKKLVFQYRVDIEKFYPNPKYLSYKKKEKEEEELKNNPQKKVKIDYNETNNANAQSSQQNGQNNTNNGQQDQLLQQQLMQGQQMQMQQAYQMQQPQQIQQQKQSDKENNCNQNDLQEQQSTNDTVQQVKQESTNNGNNSQNQQLQHETKKLPQDSNIIQQQPNNNIQQQQQNKQQQLPAGEIQQQQGVINNNIQQQQQVQQPQQQQSQQQQQQQQQPVQQQQQQQQKQLYPQQLSQQHLQPQPQQYTANQQYQQFSNQQQGFKPNQMTAQQYMQYPQMQFQQSFNNIYDCFNQQQVSQQQLKEQPYPPELYNPSLGDLGNLPPVGPSLMKLGAANSITDMAVFPSQTELGKQQADLAGFGIFNPQQYNCGLNYNNPYTVFQQQTESMQHLGLNPQNQAAAKINPQQFQQTLQYSQQQLAQPVFQQSLQQQMAPPFNNGQQNIIYNQQSSNNLTANPVQQQPQQQQVQQQPQSQQQLQQPNIQQQQTQPQQQQTQQQQNQQPIQQQQQQVNGNNLPNVNNNTNGVQNGAPPRKQTGGGHGHESGDEEDIFKKQ